MKPPHDRPPEAAHPGHPRRDALLAGLIAGLGWVLAYPPVSFWPAAVLIVWPVVRLADRRSPRPVHDAVLFGLGTVPAWAWLTRWAAFGAPAGYPLLVGYLALFAAMTCWAVARLRRVGVPMLLAGPLGWVGVEFFRGRIAFDGFPWFLAAHPLIDAPATAHSPSLAWPASLIGTYAVSGLLVLAVVILDRLIRDPRNPRVLAASLLLLLWPAGSQVGWTRCPPDAPRPVVGIIQSNVPQSIRGGWAPDDRLADWKTMRRLLTEAAGHTPRPDVLVLPETMFPGSVLQDDAARIERDSRVVWPVTAPDGRRVELLVGAIREDVLKTQQTLGVPLLIGATRFEGFRIIEEPDGLRYESDHRYNSVFLIRRGRVEPAVYDKQHLTPFGEIMPYISNWPWLEQKLLAVAASGMRFDLDEGRSRTVFSIPSSDGGVVRVVTPICFEATLSDICRGLVFGENGRRRADVIVNMTNDGWFYDAAGGRALHELAARWRCVELATPMARAANTGISAVIDRRGVAVASLEPGREGLLVSPVETCDGSTVYARIGELVGWIFFAATILGLAFSYLPGHRIRTDHARDDDIKSERGHDLKGTSA